MKHTIILPLHALIEMVFVWKLMASYQSYCLKTTKLFPCRRQTTVSSPVMEYGVRLTVVSATGIFDS